MMQTQSVAGSVQQTETEGQAETLSSEAFQAMSGPSHCSTSAVAWQIQAWLVLFHPSLENPCNIPGKLMANIEMLAHFLVVRAPGARMSSWRLPGGDQGTEVGGLSLVVRFSLPPEKRGNTIVPPKSSVKSEGFIYISINTSQLLLEKRPPQREHSSFGGFLQPWPRALFNVRPGRAHFAHLILLL